MTVTVFPEKFRIGSLDYVRVLLLITAFAVALGCALTAIPWQDEVYYVSPGAEWASGHGFITVDWAVAAEGDIWGASNPGIPYLAGLWFKLLGVGQFQSRAFFLCLYLVGVFALIRLFAARLDLGPWGRAWAWVGALFLHCLSGQAIYNARPEALAPLFFAGFVFLFWDSLPLTAARLCGIVLLAVMTVLFGLHFSGYFSLMAAGVFLLRRDKPSFFAGLAFAAGLLLGVLLLRALYLQMGVWELFLKARGEHYGKTLPWVPSGWARFFVSKDFWVLLPACAALLVVSMARGASRRLMGGYALALLLFFLIPAAVSFIGIYTSSYAWMVAFPVLAIIVPLALSTRWADGRWILLLLALLVVGSFGFRLFESVKNTGELRRREVVAERVARTVPPSVKILTSPSLYYALRGRRDGVVVPLSQTQGSQSPRPPGFMADIRWAVVSAEEWPVILKETGGEWILVEKVAQPRPGIRVGDYLVLRRR